jgi:copper resistance protein C
MNTTDHLFASSHRILLLLVSLFFTGNVFAHVALEKTIPAENAQLHTSPSELVLEFKDPVMLMKLTLTNSQSADVNLNFKAKGNLIAVHKFPLQVLNPGHYNVAWTAMGNEGHNLSGRFEFTLGAITGETKPINTSNTTNGTGTGTGNSLSTDNNSSTKNSSSVSVNHTGQYKK